VEVEHGTFGPLPYAALGAGPPLAVFAGLSPDTGFEGKTMLHATAGPFLPLGRRLVVFNRRAGLPRGMTLGEIAAEHAAALRAGPGRVDVVGISTGGSIAQQVAADHPDVVDRLVLASTACRLGPLGRSLQRRVAARIRGGDPRRALAVLVAGIVPPRRGQAVAGALGFLLGPRVAGTDLEDLAVTIEAEDDFDLAHCPPIRAPTLILAGRDDRFYSPELFAETARLIPGSELHLLEGRGHITVMNDARLKSALKIFLSAR
jgi:pimeloyl-ACP methyl ester carboxylesterase